MFYPKLNRRNPYLTKKNGKFYVYSRYRTEIAEDCLQRCVYCDAHEDEVGGASAMELDHFRPSSLAPFVNLKNDPTNLVYSCGSCNGLKHDAWPALGTAGTFIGNDGFIDPFDVDRLKYFAIRSNGRIQGKRPPASYIIGLLGLDRKFMRRLRQRRRLMAQVVALAAEAKGSSRGKGRKRSRASAQSKAVRLVVKLAKLEKRRLNIIHRLLAALASSSDCRDFRIKPRSDAISFQKKIN